MLDKKSLSRLLNIKTNARMDAEALIKENPFKIIRAKAKLDKTFNMTLLDKDRKIICKEATNINPNLKCPSINYRKEELLLNWIDDNDIELYKIMDNIKKNVKENIKGKKQKTTTKKKKCDQTIPDTLTLNMFPIVLNPDQTQPLQNSFQVEQQDLQNEQLPQPYQDNDSFFLETDLYQNPFDIFPGGFDQ